MTMELFGRMRRVRPRAAVFTALCGAATAAGSLLTWLKASGPRPAIGMSHTSLARMLVYSYSTVDSFWRSVAFVIFILGAVMAIGALSGVRVLVVTVALLALAGAGMWIGLVVHYFNTPGLPNSHYLNPANLPWGDFHVGAWLTIIGSVLGLVSAFGLRR